MSEIKVIRTDKSTYNQYVESGLWIPKTTVKYERGISGKVEADVEVKGRKSKVLAVILITDYYTSSESWNRR